MKTVVKKLWLGTLVVGSLMSSGCSSNAASVESGTTEDLTGESMFVYCGAGMTKPFSEIVDEFESETGATVEVSFGNTGQIISQIQASNEGDLFIAGDSTDLESIKDTYVEGVENLVKHIPVLAVQEGNPDNITSLSDLAEDGVEVVLGDGESTPIGKIANKALTNLDILDKVNVVARMTTAPEIANALSLGECDAVIVWKENTNLDKVEVVDTTDLDNYVKTVPAATLSTKENDEVTAAFLDYLNSSEAQDIWVKYGYEITE